MGNGVVKGSPGLIVTDYQSSFRNCAVEIIGETPRESKNNPIDDLLSLLAPKSFISKRHYVSVYPKTFMGFYEPVTNNAKNTVVLGRGMHGSVFKLKRNFDSRFVALKTVGFKHKSLKVVQDLKNELQILASIDHPSIIKLFEVFLSGEFEIAMTLELADGGDLYERLAQAHSFSEKDTIEISSQMFRCVKYLHSKQIVHRDLKLENWVFSNRETLEIKLIDFGLSCIVPENNELHDVVGTAYYMAPEVLLRKYSQSCDIWSLGVVTFMMLTGRPPFCGEVDDDLYDDIINGAPPITEVKWWRGLSPHAAAMLSKLLEIDVTVRCSIDDCLDDPWICSLVPHQPSKEEIHQFCERLEQFSELPFLKQLALRLIGNELDSGDAFRAAKKMFSFLEQDGVVHVNKVYSQLSDNITASIPALFKQLDYLNNEYLEWSEIVALYVNKSDYSEEDGVLKPICKNIFGRMTFTESEQNARLKPSHIHMFLGHNQVCDPQTVLNEVMPDLSEGMTYQHFSDMLTTRSLILIN